MLIIEYRLTTRTRYGAEYSAMCCGRFANQESFDRFCKVESTYNRAVSEVHIIKEMSVD